MALSDGELSVICEDSEDDSLDSDNDDNGARTQVPSSTVCLPSQQNKMKFVIPKRKRGPTDEPIYHRSPLCRQNGHVETPTAKRGRSWDPEIRRADTPRPSNIQHRLYQRWQRPRHERYVRARERLHRRPRRSRDDVEPLQKPVFDRRLMAPVSRLSFVILPSPLESLTPEPVPGPFVHAVISMAASPDTSIYQKVQPMKTIKGNFDELQKFMRESTNKEVWIDARRQTVYNSGLCALTGMLEEIIVWLKLLCETEDYFAPAEDIILAPVEPLCKTLLVKLRELAPCFLPCTTDYNFVKNMHYLTCATVRHHHAVRKACSTLVKQPLGLIAAYAVVVPGFINARCVKNTRLIDILGCYIEKFTPGLLNSALTQAVEKHASSCLSITCSSTTRAILNPNSASLGLFFIPGVDE
ncbi:ORF51 [callitrichine gammaherpesvirus 3]|uniref:ORF51 n=1 Tax=callitrichine gammaherpesvirus 3 TaxID=106331 RepID=Q993F8_9GAMA|nr:ORF51 [callitrichine gammaherpesvirus 3]AAK38260.1 ORF51 [callitrichine gammaherpesvirus 3]